MQALAKGENVPVSARRLQVRVSASVPVDVSALLLGADGKVATESDFVFYNQPMAAGVTLARDGVDLDLGAFPESVVRAICAVSVDVDQPCLGPGSALRATVAGPTGTPLFEFTPAGLDSERAVMLFEIYRRQGAWRVRAVGQGYQGGLAALVTAHGVEVDGATTDHPVPHAVSEVAGAVADPPGTTGPERQLRRLAGIFEDAARSAAAYRAAVTFAEQRRIRETEVNFADPRLRESAHPARQLADERYNDLIIRATTDHRRDVDQLAGELRDLTPSLPAALAPWDAPVWRSVPFGRSVGVRAGDLHLPEAPDLRIPLILSLPLRRPVWVYESAGRGSSVTTARALIIRLLAADDSLRLHLCDPDGALIAALGELAQPASGLLGAPIARGGGQRSDLLRLLAERVDLLEMARSGGALDALPLVDTKALLVINDVATLDEMDYRHLHYLIASGAAQLMIVLVGAAATGGEPDQLAGSSLVLGSVVGVDISDGWVGMSWTFTPDEGPADLPAAGFRR